MIQILDNELPHPSLDNGTLKSQKSQAPHDLKFLEAFKEFISSNFSVLHTYYKPGEDNETRKWIESVLGECLKLPDQISVKLLADGGINFKNASVFHFEKEEIATLNQEKSAVKAGDVSFFDKAYLKGFLNYQNRIYDLKIEVSSGAISINNKTATTATIERILRECSKEYDQRAQAVSSLISTEEKNHRNLIRAIRRPDGSELFLFGSSDGSQNMKLYVAKSSNEAPTSCKIDGRVDSYIDGGYSLKSTFNGKELMELKIPSSGQTRIPTIEKEHCLDVTINYIR